MLQPVLDHAPAWLLRPGTWLLESLSFSVDSDPEIGFAALVGLYAYSTALRLSWSILGRFFGFYHYQHFGLFLWTPWRPFFRVWMVLRDWGRKFRYGGRAQARLASFAEKASLVAGRKSFPVGRLSFLHFPLFQMVGLKPKAHIMMFGGTGGGKTVSLITALGAHHGSSIVIDPSAQVTNVLHARCGRGGEGILGKGQPSYCLDPDGYVRRPGFVSNCWNVFDEWDRAVARKGPDIVVKMAFTLAEGLVIKEKGEKPYFPDTAKRMAEGLSLFIYDEYKAGDPRRSLPHFRYLLSNGLDEPERLRYKLSPQEWLLWRMVDKEAKYGGVIAARARQVQEGSRSGSGDVLSTLRTQTAWLDLEQLKDISRSSDFSFEDFKKGRAHLSICAKITDLQDMYAGWFRLLTMMALYTFEDIPGELKDPCLMVVDECPNLGHLKVLDKAPAHVRKFGVRLVLIAQDVGGMKQIYPNTEGMIGNAAATIWLATDNDENVAEILKKLGKHTVLEKVPGGFMSGEKARYQPKDRELMDPSDIKEFLDLGGVIVTRRRRHLLLKPPVYFQDLPVWAYDADPDYEETTGRAALREFLRGRIAGPPPEPKPRKPAARPEAHAPRRAKKPEPPPPRPEPSSRPRRKPSASMGEGMDLETARGMYGLNGGPFTQADVEALDELVMASGHGNADYEAKVFQARAVLMQHVIESGT